MRESLPTSAPIWIGWHWVAGRGCDLAGVGESRTHMLAGMFHRLITAGPARSSLGGLRPGSEARIDQGLLMSAATAG